MQRYSLRRMASRVLAVSVATLLATTPLFAQSAEISPQHTIYIGGGKSDSYTKMPWAVGYLYLSPRSAWTFGADVAGEGAMLDNTGGYETLAQGVSLNIAIGQGVRLGRHWHLGAAVILGVRQAEKYCPTSYLGYECYANADPTYTYEGNMGALAHIAFKNVMVGARRTGESTQFLVGVAF